jgi:hypothetical protein
VNVGSSRLVWDGRELATALDAPGRRFRADPRCFAGEQVKDAWAHVCALPDEDARVPYDIPEIQQVRRDALAWWIPLLGDSLVCLTTLAVDSVNYGGAVTVATDPAVFADDPFARIFPGTTLRTSLFSQVPAPVGPGRGALLRRCVARWRVQERRGRTVIPMAVAPVLGLVPIVSLTVTLVWMSRR